MVTDATLMLVEDDGSIQIILESALIDAGFEVTVKHDGAAALEALEADPSAVRAIITDIKLGSGPDGWEIAHRARELVPTIPIVYMSGDSTQEWASKGVPGSIVLAKPFAPAQLVTGISNLLNDLVNRPPGSP